MSKKFFVGLLVLAIANLEASFSPLAVLSKLSLRQKIGQLFIVAAASNFSQPNEILASSMRSSPYNMQVAYLERLILEYEIGGIIFLYKSDPIAQLNLTNHFQKISKLPLLITQDCEWGLSMRLDLQPNLVIRYPRNLTLAAIKDDQIIYDLGYEIGQQCLAMGIHLNLAPVVDVNINSSNPVIHDRSFGDDPILVSKKALSFMDGLQAAGVLACAKHFPGHGDTNIDSHFGLPTITKDRHDLLSVELQPFKKLIQAGIDAIMPGHLQVPALDGSGLPATLSKKMVTDLLQDELGFTGLKITDGLGMGAVMKDYAPGELELKAFLAGNDLILCPLDVPKAIDLIEQAVLKGQVDVLELDRRVLKVLQAKAHVLKKQHNLNKQQILAFLIRPAAQELQEKAYRAAITQVRSNQAIKLNTQIITKSLFVQVGSLAQSYFSQTLRALNFPASFTLENQQQVLQFAQNYDQVVLALGDINKDLVNNFGISIYVLDLVQKLKKINKNIAVVLFGTPYSADLFKLADLLLVAYEDLLVTQQAVIDVLTGKLNPTGTLPIKIAGAII